MQAIVGLPPALAGGPQATTSVINHQLKLVAD
jgi:hypothetical protein